MTRTRPVFDQLNVVSGDPAASIAFYRRLGVDIPDETVWRTASGVHHVHASGATDGPVELELDSVAFARKWNPAWHTATDLRGRVVIGFRVPSRSDVDRLYADMTGAGYVGLHAPHDAFWGSRYAILEDPDGIAVGLMSPPSADKRSAPPEV
jgi:catechol 2,3-dioxygenase-like lactoylglutathione lyase family enzyme